MAITKICSKCGEEFPASRAYFHADPCRKDGLRSDCANCVRKRNSERKRAKREALRESRPTVGK